MKPMTPMTLPYDIDDPALARATWSRLAEPDNATAAMVVGRLGPSPPPGAPAAGRRLGMSASCTRSPRC